MSASTNTFVWSSLSVWRENIASVGMEGEVATESVVKTPNPQLLNKQVSFVNVASNVATDAQTNLLGEIVPKKMEEDDEEMQEKAKVDITLFTSGKRHNFVPAICFRWNSWSRWERSKCTTSLLASVTI